MIIKTNKHFNSPEQKADLLQIIDDLFHAHSAEATLTSQEYDQLVDHLESFWTWASNQGLTLAFTDLRIEWLHDSVEFWNQVYLAVSGLRHLSNPMPRYKVSNTR